MPASPTMQPTSKPPIQAGPARRLFHLIVAVAGWVLFVYWWWLVMRRVSDEDIRFTGFFLFVTFVICVTVTAAWSFHNHGIFRRRGPRTKVREVPEDFSRDRLGRAVSFKATTEQLKAEPIVHIRLEHDGKVYRPGSSVNARDPNGTVAIPKRTAL